MTTPTQVLVVVNFQDSAGNPLANGSVTFDLSKDMSIGVSNGPQVSAGRKVIAALDATGTAFVNLWPNDTLLPSGSVYFVNAYTAQGQPAWNGQITVSATGLDYLLLEDGTLILLESGGPVNAILLES